MKRAFAIAAVALLVLVAGGAAADSFSLTVVATTNTTITFSYPAQSGYGYLYSAKGVVVSQTNDPTKTTVKFSKNAANDYEVASKVKGTTGHYQAAPPAGDTTPPSVPSNLHLVSASQTKIVFAWNASTDNVGVVDYRVYRGATLLGNSSNTLDWADNNVLCDTSYQYGVQAVDAAGNASQTATSSFSAAACSTPPPPPPSGDFPNASNTGVPPGTTLTAYTGPSNITTANTVIDGKTMGCIDINAANVLIKNSKISCGGTDYYAVFVDNGSLTIQDSEIDCKNRSSNGEGGAFVTYIRVEISLCENGASPEHDFTIRDSYIHDLYEGGDAHGDGMQAENAAYNIFVLHNTIIGMGSNGDRATSAIISDLPTMHDWTIQGNWLSGGQYTLYCATGPDPGYSVRDNAFALQYGVDGWSGHYGFATECGDDVQSGNYVYETGQPIFLP
jgi:hypothetical protein